MKARIAASILSADFGSDDYADAIADMQNSVTRAVEETHAEAD